MGRRVKIKLPDAARAIVERKKITEYLLNPRHRYGASKARFFGRFGFRVEHWEALAIALGVHGKTHEVKHIHKTKFGPRYEVEGHLPAPDGRSPCVRSVWQFDEGEVAPRLITAYPLED